MIAVSIARDYAGLRVAADELLEAWLADQQKARLLGARRPAANQEALLKTFEVRRSLTAGYYERAEHLFRLAQMEFRIEHLSADQAHGVRAIEAASEEFAERHPGCPHCRKPLENAGAFTCWNCSKKIERTR